MVKNDEHKVPFLTSGGVTHNWATNVFKHRVEVDANNKVFFKVEDNTYESEEQYFTTFFVEKVWLLPRAGVCTDLLEHPVLMMPHTKCGFHIWWSAPAFFKNWGILPDTLTLGRTLLNRHDKFLNLAKAAGLHELCVRKAAPTAHIKAQSDPNKTNRVWDVPSFATHFMIRVLVRWAFAKKGAGGLQDDSGRRVSAAKDALQSMLNVIAEKDYLIHVGPQVTWKPPCQPWASTCVTLPCQKLVFDFQHLMSRFPKWEATKQVVKSLLPGQGSIPSKMNVIHFLEVAQRAGPKAEDLLNQAIWGLGAAVEGALLKDLIQKAKAETRQREDGQGNQEQHSSAPSQETTHEAVSSKDDHLEEDRMPDPPAAKKEPKGPVGKTTYTVEASSKKPEAPATKREQEVFLDAYERGAKKKLKGQLMVGLAIDGARVAKQALLLAALACPSGEAVWAPPQVSDDYAGESALAIFGDDDEDALEDAKQVILITL